MTALTANEKEEISYKTDNKELLCDYILRIAQEDLDEDDFNELIINAAEKTLENEG